MFGFNLMEMVAGLPGLIMALALHEYAHARAAVAMWGLHAAHDGTADVESACAY